MPIRPELRPLYRTKAFLDARCAVLERAGNRCERCAKPQDEVLVIRDGSGYWWGERTGQDLLDLLQRADCEEEDRLEPDWLTTVSRGARRSWVQPGDRGPVFECQIQEFVKPPVLIKSVIGIAHLDHNPTNNSLANLAALCAHCHFKQDAGQHRHNVRRTKAERNGQLWIAPALEERI
jgi:5-methylcytosine-specific restriction endonuclease McrA